METTINNATDFALPKTLNAENWRALRKVGAATNARFLAALGEGQPARRRHLGVRRAAHHPRRQPPGLRFGDPRTMALLAQHPVAAFSHVIGGLTNRTLCAQMAVLWNPDYSQGQASYDLRRLRLKGFIERVAHTNTYRVTAHGRRMATFFTKLATPVVIPALTELAAPLRPPKAAPQPVREAWRAYERTPDALVRPGRGRRYHVPPEAARTVTALLALREHVIAPIVAGVRSPRLGGKPAHWTAVDRDYETLRIGMQNLFDHLAITTQAA